MNLFDTMIGLLAPHECVGCGFEGALLCPECETTLPRPVSRCYKCHRATQGFRTCRSCRRTSHLFSVVSVTRYEAAPRDLVWRLKYQRARSAAREIARQLSLLVDADVKDVVITFVPTATSRMRTRGYDQAQLVARELAALTGHPCRRLLVRQGQHRQVGAHRAARLAQLREDFRPLGGHMHAGKRVILIDDVVTTGATLEAAAAALKSIGAKRVEAIVFAQA